MSYNKVDTLPREYAERIFKRRQERATWEEIEAEFDISSPRAKTLLKRHGFDHSPLGDLRYASSRIDESVTMWNRPCLKCGRCERRPKGLFRCKVCRREARDDYNAADSMYAAGNGVSRAGGVPV